MSELNENQTKCAKNVINELDLDMLLGLGGMVKPVVEESGQDNISLGSDNFCEEAVQRDFSEDFNNLTFKDDAFSMVSKTTSKGSDDNFKLGKESSKKDLYPENINVPSEFFQPSVFTSQSIVKSSMSISSNIPSSTSSLDLKYIIKNRIAKLSNQYIFNQNYSDNLITFFRKFNSILMAKIEYSFDFHRKFTLFFKNISQCYFKFAKDLEKCNELINTVNNQGMILSHNINYMMEQAQNQITSYFENFSMILTNKMITGGIKENKIKEFYSRLAFISKDFDFTLNRIVKHRLNVAKEYSQFSKLFEDFKSVFTDSSALGKLMSKHDFYYVEHRLTTCFRITDTLTKDFLLQYKEKLLNMQVLLLDYVMLIKESLDVYVEENQKIFNESGVIPASQLQKLQKVVKEKEEACETKPRKKSKKESEQINNKNLNFDEMKRHFDSLNKESLEEVFSTKRIINYEEIDIDKEYLKTLNDILGEYHRNLLIANYGNVGNLDIKDFERFKLENHQTFRAFLDFMILVNPLISSKLNEYLLYEFNVKRENGVILQKWQLCKIVVTVQGSVFIFDESQHYNENALAEQKESKLIERLAFKSVKFLEKDSKKNPYTFSLIDSKKGIIFTSKMQYEFNAENSENFEVIKRAFEAKK